MSHGDAPASGARPVRASPVNCDSVPLAGPSTEPTEGQVRDRPGRGPLRPDPTEYLQWTDRRHPRRDPVSDRHRLTHDSGTSQSTSRLKALSGDSYSLLAKTRTRQSDYFSGGLSRGAEQADTPSHTFEHSPAALRAEGERFSVRSNVYLDRIGITDPQPVIYEPYHKQPLTRKYCEELAKAGVDPYRDFTGKQTSARKKRSLSADSARRRFPRYLFDTSTSVSSSSDDPHSNTSSRNSEASDNLTSSDQEELDQTLTGTNEDQGEEAAAQQYPSEDEANQQHLSGNEEEVQQPNPEPEGDQETAEDPPATGGSNGVDGGDAGNNGNGDGNGDDDNHDAHHNQNLNIEQQQQADMADAAVTAMTEQMRLNRISQIAQNVLPKQFKGSEKQNVEDFFNALDNYCIYTGQSNEADADIGKAKLDLLNSMILGHPKSYLEKIDAGQKDSYTKVKTLLIDKYGPKTRGLTHRLAISRKYMTSTQTVEEFSTWYSETCKLAGIKDEEKKTLYIERLTKPLKGYVLDKDSNPKTYERAYELALMGESINALKADIDPSEEHAAKTVLALAAKPRSQIPKGTAAAELLDRLDGKSAEVNFFRQGPPRGRGRGSGRGRGRYPRAYNPGQGNSGYYRQSRPYNDNYQPRRNQGGRGFGSRGGGHGRGRGYFRGNNNNNRNFNYSSSNYGGGRSRGRGRGNNFRGQSDRRQAAQVSTQAEDDYRPAQEDQPWEY